MLFVSAGVAQTETTEPPKSKMAVQAQPAAFEPPATDVNTEGQAAPSHEEPAGQDSPRVRSPLSAKRGRRKPRVV